MFKVKSVLVVSLVLTSGLIIGHVAVGGQILPYDAEQIVDTKIWTNWHVKTDSSSKVNIAMALLKLSKIRSNLAEKNLNDAYVNPRTQVRTDGSKVECKSVAEKLYRQNDGTCNNLTDNKIMGSVGSRFSRNLMEPKTLPKKVTEQEILSPNPLEISEVLLSRKSAGSNYLKNPTLNAMAGAWIQFQTHDWFNHQRTMDDFSDETPYHVTYKSKKGDKEIILPRNVTASREGDDPGYDVYSNSVTHWWDGSQIYGSSNAAIDCANNKDSKKIENVRDCNSWGRLRMTAENTLPVSLKDGKEITGFNQNWWVGLTFLHTLFARNHNRIADQLHAAYPIEKYPAMTAHKIFNIARLINAAVMAKIHTVEWTPQILGNPYLNMGMQSNWYGLEKGKKKYPETVGRIQEGCQKWVSFKEMLGFAPNTPSVCEILGGIVGINAPKLFGKPYSLTEEFVAVYRLHSLLPEKLKVAGTSTEVALEETREAKSSPLVKKVGLPLLTRSMGEQNAGSLQLHNFPRFLQDIKIPMIGTNLDMAAVDLMRDRERAIPKYNEFRRQLQLLPIKDFSDLMPTKATRKLANGSIMSTGISEAQAAENVRTLDEMRRIYGNDVEKIDLLVGSLAESYRPEGYGFGETLFQVFINMASRRLQADRFYTTDFNAKIYTRLGMKIIDDSTMKSLIVDNIGIDAASIPDNAFAPWTPEGAKNPTPAQLEFNRKRTNHQQTYRAVPNNFVSAVGVK